MSGPDSLPADLEAFVERVKSTRERIKERFPGLTDEELKEFGM